METRNRNILLIAFAALVLVCCCCALWSGTLLALLLPRTTARQPQLSPVAVEIAPLATAEETATLEAPAETRPAESAAPTTTATPAAGSGTSPATEQSTTPTTGAGTNAATVVPTGAVGAAATSVSSELALAQATIPAADERILAERLKPGVGNIPATVNPTPPSYKVGDKISFWVENGQTQAHRQISATLQYVTPHVYEWVENGIQPNLNDIRRSADLFESKTYPTDRKFFGSEWTPGVDNDVHLSILYANELGQGIAAYYSSADEFSHLVNRYSNEKEMFYVAAIAGQTQSSTSFDDGVLAHEFQHMIHWRQDPQEDAWVNEGMADLAMHLNGFDVGGADIAYAQQPDTQLTTWTDPNEGNGNLNHYGAAYLFLNYFLDRFGEQLTKDVVASKKQGAAGFNEALAKAGRPERFDDVFADWLVANDLNLPNAEPKGQFGYAGITPEPPAVMERYTRFPASGKAQVSQYAADYIQLQGNGNLTVDFSGQTTVTLANTEPSGRYAWYSNRGDDSDTTLTRPFDLRELTSATLTFSAWYDIEDGWDYVYLEASTDGGQHWQILPGRQTTDKDKSGNAFGPGYTGMSGGGKTAQWANERVDLSSFAGKQIQLRFEYVTDGELNKPGFLLDNIAISELNYSDDAEKGDGGWQAAGWVRSDNTLTERWLVQLLASDGSTVQLQRMPVGADGKGRLTLANAEKYSHIMLIVSPLAPVTTEPASYGYTITNR
jgi:immune inhibitor A